MFQRILNLIFRPIFGCNLPKKRELRKMAELTGKIFLLAVVIQQRWKRKQKRGMKHAAPDDPAKG
ncbi:hypothetical protein [Brucella intermedia]|uniref:hypothetical protein n=1 Tax=Brucella intermedia TaxID=94625 RepID=UPI00124CC333|nr:hypothetical protein [Brucella intermedia]KAB2730382.1 hypothetical protein F9L02_09895 [Brucella intermedia]